MCQENRPRVAHIVTTAIYPSIITSLNNRDFFAGGLDVIDSSKRKFAACGSSAASGRLDEENLDWHYLLYNGFLCFWCWYLFLYYRISTGLCELAAGSTSLPIFTSLAAGSASLHDSYCNSSSNREYVINDAAS